MSPVHCCSLPLEKTLIVAAVTAALSATPGFSQESPGRSVLALEEVVVTARKREESLQDVPVAVTALSAAALQDAGLTRLQDLSDRVPGLDLTAGNGVNGDVNPYIRGVGQRETKVTLDSSVGIYVDGVYMSRAPSMLDTSDVASIQVLRGPAGTLFGKNTTGGAILYTLNKPTDELGGDLALRVGNHGRLNGEAVVNFPLGDAVALRASINQVSSDGYVRNPLDGEDYNYDDRLSAVGQLRWFAGEDVTVDLLASVGRTRQEPRLGNCVDWGFYASLGAMANNNPSVGQTSLVDACARISPAAGIHLGSRSMPQAEYRVDDQIYAGTVTWDIGSAGAFGDLQFKSITSYRNLERRSDEDIDMTELAIVDNFEPNETETDAYSQEFQITGSTLDTRLRFTTGLHYFTEDAEQPDQTSRIGPLVAAVLPAAAVGFPDGTAWVALVGSSSQLTRKTDNEAFAWYGQLNYDVTDKLELTLGLRYTDETRESAFSRWAVNGIDAIATGDVAGPVGATALVVQSPTACAATGNFCDALTFNYDWTTWNFNLRDGVGQAEGEVDFQEWTPMASLAYNFADDALTEQLDSAMVYFTYSEGFRSGGIVNQASLLRLGQVNTFDPEYVTNYELGFKFDAFDSSLRVNGALYYMDFKDQQLSVVRLDPISGQPNPSVANAGQSEITGVDLEVTWLAAENLMITGSFAFIDAQLKEFDDFITGPDGNTVPVDRSAEDLPFVPEQQVFLAAEYTFDLGNGSNLVPRLEATYKSEIYRGFGWENWVNPTARDLTTSDDPWFLNARLSWHSADDRFSVALWGTNLTDEDDYYVGGIPGVNYKGVVGRIYAEPRMYGLDIRYRWGG
ncbi:MAG: TonB-dependent receptor [Halioglobus sp.]|nr:TonB-dependent receptor [Halioglobus sp.]